MFGINKQAKQDVCFIPESEIISDIKLISGVLHIEDFKNVEAWSKVFSQQCRDEITGKYFQFISSLSPDPVQIYRNSPVKDTAEIASVASQREDAEMVFVEDKKRKDSRVVWLGICLAMLTLTVCMIAYLSVIK